VVESLAIPEGILREYPDLLEPLDEHAGAKLARTIRQESGPDLDAQVECTVIGGNPLTEMLRMVKAKQVDLLVVGAGNGFNAGSGLSWRLARKAPCSVLAVPNGAPPRITRILVAIDFSEHAAEAMSTAIGLAVAAGLSDLLSLHLYRVPSGYARLGHTYEEFAEIMRRNAEEAHGRFMAQFDLQGLSVLPKFVLSDDPCDAIWKAIEDERADLAVVGARGRTAAAAVLMGSVTEGLLSRLRVPLLAVKNKGPGMTALDALLAL